MVGNAGIAFSDDFQGRWERGKPLYVFLAFHQTVISSVFGSAKRERDISFTDMHK
jgi:hypothetical protein